MVILLSWLYGLSNDPSSGKNLHGIHALSFNTSLLAPIFTERPWWNQVFSIVCLCSSLNLHDHQGKLSRLPLVNHKITVVELHTLSKRLKLWAAHKRSIQLCIYFTHQKFKKPHMMDHTDLSDMASCWETSSLCVSWIATGKHFCLTWCLTNYWFLTASAAKTAII